MDRKQAIQEYLNKHAVLVVDKNPSSRNRLLKVMVDIGAKRANVHTAGTMAEAEAVLSSQEVGLVLSDYEVGGGSGFDLFKIVREKFAKNKKLTLILVTSNISQTAVAKAAEEDVDSFIIKPYTIQSIQENLLSSISAKIQPSPYIIKIEEGKALMGAGDYEASVKVFTDALPLHPKPSLAMFYMGQAQYLLQLKDVAKGQYNKGLALNSIHFKCLVGLYELFMKDKKHDEAYQVVKKVAKYFPANPDRLTQIVRLAIITKNYEDMESYYDLFTALDERDSNMTNYLGAGLYVTGKWFLLEGRASQAMQVFDKIAVSCSEFTKFLRAMVTVLAEHGQASAAEKFLSRFHPDAYEHEDYLVSDYIVRCNLAGAQPGELTKKGLELYNRGIRDYHCLRLMVESMTKQGLKDKAKPYQDELNKLYPEKSGDILAA